MTLNNNPPVPSREALKFLRRLAFGYTSLKRLEYCDVSFTHTFHNAYAKRAVTNEKTRSYSTPPKPANDGQESLAKKFNEAETSEIFRHTLNRARIRHFTWQDSSLADAWVLWNAMASSASGADPLEKFVNTTETGTRDMEAVPGQKHASKTVSWNRWVASPIETTPSREAVIDIAQDGVAPSEHSLHHSKPQEMSAKSETQDSKEEQISCAVHENHSLGKYHRSRAFSRGMERDERLQRSTTHMSNKNALPRQSEKATLQNEFAPKRSTKDLRSKRLKPKSKTQRRSSEAPNMGTETHEILPNSHTPSLCASLSETMGAMSSSDLMTSKVKRRPMASAAAVEKTEEASLKQAKYLETSDKQVRARSMHGSIATRVTSTLQQDIVPQPSQVAPGPAVNVIDKQDQHTGGTSATTERHIPTTQLERTSITLDLPIHTWRPFGAGIGDLGMSDMWNDSDKVSVDHNSSNPEYLPSESHPDSEDLSPEASLSAANVPPISPPHSEEVQPSEQLPTTKEPSNTPWAFVTYHRPTQPFLATQQSVAEPSISALNANVVETKVQIDHRPSELVIPLNEQVLTGPQTAEEQLQTDPTPHLPLVQQESEQAPEAMTRTQIETSIITSKTQLRTDKTLMGFVQEVEKVGRNAWHSIILKHMQEKGRAAAYILWRDALTFYTPLGGTGEWETVFYLYNAFRNSFRHIINPPPVKLLLRYLLDDDSAQQQWAELLFPTRAQQDQQNTVSVSQGTPLSTSQITRALFGNARLYLEEVWNETNDVDRLISALRKVIRAAKSRSIRLAEDLFVDPIRKLSLNGHTAEAQILFDEMMYYHQIRPSFYSRSPLVLGYARTRDWKRVARHFEAMHATNVSRKEPIGFAEMFNRVLIEVGHQRSLTETHDFLVHAVGYWGLVPTSAVSATAVEIYLRHRQYHLVREWVQMVRILFPQVSFQGMAFSWHLADFWEKTNATCEDIEEAYKALTFRQEYKEAHPTYKSLIREALARDLAFKLQAVEGAESGAWARRKHEIIGLGTYIFYLERAEAVISQAAQEKVAVAKNEELEDLHTQAESAKRLNAMLHQKRYVDTSSEAFEPQGPSSPSHRRKIVKNNENSSWNLDPLLQQVSLPQLDVLTKLVLAHYARQEASTPPWRPNHSILVYLCGRLVRESRQVEAAKLLSKIFKSGYVQGFISPAAMFDLSIFELWLKLGYELKSINTVRFVLRQVHDREILVTRKFLLLAQMAGARVFNNRFTPVAPANMKPAEVRAECNELIERLHRRFSAQRGLANPRESDQGWWKALPALGG